MEGIAHRFDEHHRPASVFGPVDKPPWKRQRAFPSSTLTKHLPPARVFAPHRGWFLRKLIEAAKNNRHGHRDALMVLLTYRHGLRAAEVVDLRWEQVDFKTGTLHVRRVKNGTPATHPLTGRELRTLRRTGSWSHRRILSSRPVAQFETLRFCPIALSR
jgi:integrase